MVLKKYAYHKPSDEGVNKIKTIREAYSNLEAQLSTLCPQSRELSVAITNLETSAMWAVKAAVINDPNSTTPEVS